MADRAKPAREAENPRPTQSSPDNVPEEQTYTVEQLLEAPKLAGARSRHEVAGALGRKSRRTHTLEQAAKAVTDFRAHKDQTERGE